MRYITVIILILICASLNAQDNFIDLGTDTIYYDADYEYVVAFETEAGMESFVFYRSALKAYKENDLLSAKAMIKKSIKLNKNEVKFKMLQAWINSKEGSYKKAIKLSKKVLEEHPNYKEAHYCKALNHFLLGEYLSANIGFSYLIEMDDADFQAYYGRAETRLKLDDLQGAVNDYTKALAANRTLTEAYKGRGIAYSKMYDFKSAIKDFNQALTSKPNDGELYYYRGVCYLRSSDFSNACMNFEDALKLNYRAAAEYYNKNCKF